LVVMLCPGSIVFEEFNS